MVFIFAPQCPRNAYFCVIIPKRYLKNLVTPNLFSFTLQYADPAFLLSTHASNAPFIVSSKPLCATVILICAKVISVTLAEEADRKV
jgi:hypothetical protein